MLLLFAFSAVLLALAAVRLIRPMINAFRDRLAAKASEALGMEVFFGQMALSPASGFELSVKGLGARKDGVEALAMKELRIKLDPLRLLRREAKITRLTLVAPVIYLARHKDGSFNFSGGRAFSGKAAAIARLVVRQGRLVYTDEETGLGVEADGVEFDIDNFTYGGRRDDGPLKKVFFAGEIRCAALKTEGLSATAVSLRLNAGKGVFKADPFSLTAAGMTGGGSLLLDLGAPAPVYKMSYASGRFKLEDVLPVLYRGDSVWRDLRGSAVLRADVAASGSGAEALRRSLAGTVALEGKDLRLPARGGGPDFLKAEAVVAAADASNLARGSLRLKSVSLAKPAVYLRRQAASGPKSAGRPAAAAQPFLIDELSAAGGSFIYAADKGSKIVTSENVDLTLKGFSYGGSGGTAAEVSLGGGELKCSTFTFGGEAATGLVLGVTAVKSVFGISPLRMKVFGGEGSGRLQAYLGASTPRYTLFYTLRQFRMGEFLTVFSRGKAGPRDVRGRADLDVNLTARGKDPAELVHTLAGRVALRGKGLALPGIGVDEVITKYVRSQNFNLLDVGAFLLAGPLGPAVTKSYNFADAGLSRGKNGVVLGLSSIWSVKDGTARAEDVALATLKYRLAMKGGLDLADGHFEGVKVAVLDKKGCAAYEQSIQGTFAHPTIGKITMLTSLAGPVLGVLDTVQKLNPFQQCEVFYSGSVPQPK